MPTSLSHTRQGSNYSFLKYILLIMLLQLSQFFSPCSAPYPPAVPTPFVMLMGCTYNFFGFCISYAILNLPLSILCLPVMLLIPCTFCLILSSTHTPPIILHVIFIYSDLSFCSCSSCFLSFCFCFLGSVVESCEFVVILLFIVFYLLLFLR